jgi:hypothetical protein
MKIHIDNTPLFLIGLLLFILFLPQFFLLLIFSAMYIKEWLNNLFQKIVNLLSCIYDIILCIISNPIILTGLIIYLCLLNTILFYGLNFYSLCR